MERRDRALKACTASSAMLTNYRSKEMWMGEKKERWWRKMTEEAPESRLWMAEEEEKWNKDMRLFRNITEKPRRR